MSLDALPVEILSRICDSFRLFPRGGTSAIGLDLYSRHDDVQQINRQTLRALCLVCKRIAEIASENLWSAIVPPFHYGQVIWGFESVGQLIEVRDLEWVHRLEVAISTRHNHLEAASFYHLQQPQVMHQIRNILPRFENLRTLEIGGLILDMGVAEGLCKAITGLPHLRNLIIQCYRLLPNVFFALLARLPSDRIYEGVRIVHAGADWYGETPFIIPSICMRVQALQLDYGWTNADDILLAFFQRFDRNVLERLVLARESDDDADFIERVLGVGWPALHSLELRGLDAPSFSGWGREEDCPSLRSVTLQGAMLSYEEMTAEPIPGQPPLHELMLAQLPSTVRNLYLDTCDCDDPIGLMALVRLMRHPHQPLRNVKFICFPLSRLDRWRGNEETYALDCLQMATDICEELHELAKQNKIRVEPADLQYKLQTTYRARLEQE